MRKQWNKLAKEQKNEERNLAISFVARSFSRIDLQVCKRLKIKPSTVHAVWTGFVASTPDGTCSTIGQESLGAKTGYSRSTVNRATTALREMGFIFTKHCYRTNELGEKRQERSFTVIKTFKNKYYLALRKVLQRLKNTSLNSVVALITKRGATIPKKDTSYSLIVSEKVKGVVFDTETGEIYQPDEINEDWSTQIKDKNTESFNEYWNLRKKSNQGGTNA